MAWIAGDYRLKHPGKIDKNPAIRGPADLDEKKSECRQRPA
jgi:hypothetical protein